MVVGEGAILGAICLRSERMNFSELRRSEVRIIHLPRTPLNRVQPCEPALLIEDILDLLERVSRENVGGPQIR